MYAEASDLSAEPASRTELLRKSALHFLSSGRSSEGLPRLRELFAAEGIFWPRTRAGALVRALFGLLWAWLSGVHRSTAALIVPSGVGTPASEASALDRLLEGAGCIPPYDYFCGVYFMSVYVRRALRSRQAPHASVALAMSATMFASARPTQDLARRLVDQACAIARSHDVFYLRSAALCFAAWARLVDDRLPDALRLSIEADDTLRSSGHTHIYQVWAARTVQSMALFAMGRVRDAVALFAANARLARELGDDMAVIGGDSVLRYLVVDDLDRAHALVEHKASLLARSESAGGLRDFVQVERVLCALYAGRGAEVMPQRLRRFPLAMPEYGTLAASCALQALPAAPRVARRVTQRTVQRLRLRDRSSADRAMAAQFDAALRMMEGDIAGATARVCNAADLYHDVNMALHSAVMRLRHAELCTGDPEARRAGEDARRWMLSEGIVRPDAFVRMLAPGF